MVMIFVLLTITIFSVADTKDYEKCYEKLESIQIRWTIQNYYARKEGFNELILSPSFPIDSTTETKWTIRFSPKGATVLGDGLAGFFLCRKSSFREKEMVSVSCTILGTDFDSSEFFVPGNFDEPQYYSKLCNQYEANQFRISDLAQNVTSTGSLDLLIVINRLRKLPLCINADETDLGRGNMTTLSNPPITKAIHCTTKSDVTGETFYTWIDQLPANPEIGFEVVSPVFPSTTDTHQWLISLKKIRTSDEIYLVVRLISNPSVTAKVLVTFYKENTYYIRIFTAREYSARNPFYEYRESYMDYRNRVFNSENKWNVTIHVFIVNKEETCEAVGPWLGQKQRVCSNGENKPTGMDDKCKQMETTVKELQETNKKLEISIKDMQQSNEGGTARTESTESVLKVMDEKLEEKENLIKLKDKQIKLLKEYINSLVEKGYVAKGTSPI